MKVGQARCYRPNLSLRPPLTVSGTVVKVEPVPDMTGYRKLAITIDVEDDIWEKLSTQLRK